MRTLKSPLDVRPAQSVSFWNRNFFLALFGYFFLFMSVTIFFLLPLFLKQFNPRESQVGLIMGIHSMMAIGIRPLFGRVIDKKGGKRVALFGIVLLAATVPLFHLVKDAGIFPLLLRALTGLGWGISMTATITLCSDLAPADRIAHSIGIIGVAGLVSAALGPMVGEEVIRRFGFPGLFNASIVFLIVSFILVISAREAAAKESSEPSSNLKILRTIPLWAVFVIASMPIFHGAVRGTMVNFIALFAKSIHIDRVGPFFVLFSVAAIMTRFGMGDLSDRYGRKRVIFPAACLISLNLFVLSQVKSFIPFVVTGFVGGLGQGLIFPALSTYIIDCLGRENKGLAISLYLSLFDVGMGLGSPFFGWISDMFGYRRMYIFAGAFLLVSTFLFMAKAPTPAMCRNGEPRIIPGGQL